MIERWLNNNKNSYNKIMHRWIDGSWNNWTNRHRRWEAATIWSVGLSPKRVARVRACWCVFCLFFFLFLSLRAFSHLLPGTCFEVLLKFNVLNQPSGPSEIQTRTLTHTHTLWLARSYKCFGPINFLFKFKISACFFDTPSAPSSLSFNGF